MQNASGKQCLIATSLLVVILVATDADVRRERERGRESKEDERLRGGGENQRLSRPLALFRDNPISLRRFSIFTTSFVLAADSVADGHSKYSRNLVFTPPPLLPSRPVENRAEKTSLGDEGRKRWRDEKGTPPPRVERPQVTTRQRIGTIRLFKSNGNGR